MNKTKLLLVVGVISLGITIFLSIVSAASWTPPTIDFPNGSPNAPLDQSNFDQTKPASLNLKGLDLTTNGLPNSIKLGSDNGIFSGPNFLKLYQTGGDSILSNPSGLFDINAEGIILPRPVSAPTTPTAGTIYYKSSDKSVQLYTGVGATGWQAIGAGGSGGTSPSQWKNVAGGIAYGASIVFGPTPVPRHSGYLTYYLNNDQTTANQFCVDDGGGYTIGTINVTTNIGGGVVFYASGSWQTTGGGGISVITQVTCSDPPNVGIGTASPGTTLDVKGQAGMGSVAADEVLANKTGLVFPSVTGGYARVSSAVLNVQGSSYGGNLLFATRDNSGGDALERMRITSTGKVGIGTPTPAEALEVSGNPARVRVMNTVGNPELQLQYGTRADDHWGIFASNLNNPSGGDGSLNIWSQDIFEGEPTGSSRNIVSITPDDSTGKTAKFSVSGQLCIGTSCIGSWNDVKSTFTLSGTKDYLPIWATNSTLGTSIIFQDPTNGNVGIGMTNPSSLLHLYKNVSGINAEIAIQSGNGTAVQDKWSIYQDQTGGGLRFWNSNAPGDKNALTILKSGNVGIGTTGPTSKLAVYGAGQLTANLTDAGGRGDTLELNSNTTSAGSGGALVFGNIQSQSAGSIGFAAIKGLLTNGASNTVGDLAFSTRNAVGDTALTERMRIASGGNVGIGTNFPSKKLNIYGGDILIQSGSVYFESPLIPNAPSLGDATAIANVPDGLSPGTYVYAVTYGGRSGGGETQANGYTNVGAFVSSGTGGARFDIVAPSDQRVGSFYIYRASTNDPSLYRRIGTWDLPDSVGGLVTHDKGTLTKVSTNSYTFKDLGVPTGFAKLPPYPTFGAGFFLKNEQEDNYTAMLNFIRIRGLENSTAQGRKSFIGVNTDRPSQMLEVLGVGSVPVAANNTLNSTDGNTARLRVTDTNNNPELQLQYGTGVNDHWGIYANNKNDDGSVGDKSLNFWNGLNSKNYKINPESLIKPFVVYPLQTNGDITCIYLPTWNLTNYPTMNRSLPYISQRVVDDLRSGQISDFKVKLTGQVFGFENACNGTQTKSATFTIYLRNPSNVETGLLTTPVSSNYIFNEIPSLKNLIIQGGPGQYKIMVYGKRGAQQSDHVPGFRWQNMEIVKDLFSAEEIFYNENVQLYK